MPRQLYLIAPDKAVPLRVLADFLVSREATGCAQSTLDFYRRELSAFLCHPRASGDRCPWPPGPRDVERYLAHRRRTVSDASVRTTWNALSAFLNWCERRGHLRDNPLKVLDKPRKPHHIPKAAPPAAIARLLATICQAAGTGDVLAIRDRALIALLYDTGLRASETAGALLTDLDLAYGSLLIRSGKGDRDRVVYFGAGCSDALRQWTAIHPGSPWLFVSRLRVELRPLTRRGIYTLVRRWSERAGVDVYPHQLRHSCASHALRAGVSLRDVQAQLGHASISTTALYLDTENGERRAAFRARSPLDELG